MFVKKEMCLTAEELCLHKQKSCATQSRCAVQLSASVLQSRSQRSLHCLQGREVETPLAKVLFVICFGHMKDEIDLYGCTRFVQVKAIIDDGMDYYNTERYQWQLAKLAPDEYYKYITTGEYPLSIKEP